MSIGFTAIWRIRVAGDDTNGGGYDPAISGAGTDYSQQDAAQLSLTDVACAGGGSTTVTSATGGFTSAMIGNAIRITGGGATSGYYFILTRTNANTITVDRSPGTVSGATGKVGGAAATPARLLNNANATDDKVNLGNTVYIRGAGSDMPGSDDYATTGSFTLVGGISQQSPIRILSENGRARLSSNGAMWATQTNTIIEGFYFTATGTTGASNGIINVGSDSRIRNCVVNTNSQAGLVGIRCSNGISIDDCEIWSGSTSPTISSDAHLIHITSYGCSVRRCRIHHGRYNGIKSDNYGLTIEDCLIYKNVAEGLYITAGSLAAWTIKNNTFDGNGNGFTLVNNGGHLTFSCVNNIFSNHTSVGTFAFGFLAADAATNDTLVGTVDYNAFYNNTNHRNKISAGAHDVDGVDPQYVDAVNGDYRIETNLAGAGTPGTWRGGSQPTGYPDIGAVQRQETGGSGTVMVMPRRKNLLLKL